MSFWFITLPLGIATWAMRSGFILWGTMRQLPSAVQRALDFVPPAILAALVFPTLIPSSLTLSLLPIKLIAGILAALVHWRFRKVLLTIAVGMLVLWLLQAVSTISTSTIS